MATLDCPDDTRFDNLTAALGALTAGSAPGSITISFAPLSSKETHTLKLFGSFDAMGNIVSVDLGSYSLPDARTVTLIFPEGTTAMTLPGQGAGSVRVDQLLQQLFGGDDWLRLGSQADRIAAGAGNDFVAAGAGDDTVQGGAGDDFIDGGAGLDTALFAGARSAYLLNTSERGHAVADQTTGRDGTDTLTGIERLHFADARVAIDLDGHAGTVVRMLGVVFGAKSATDARQVGLGLAHLDAGGSAEALAASLLGATGMTAPADIVSLLWTHLAGSAPSPEQAAPFVDLLQRGTISAGQLVVAAAGIELAADIVDLVGLAKSGVEFVPVGG